MIIILMKKNQTIFRKQFARLSTFYVHLASRLTDAVDSGMKKILQSSGGSEGYL